MFWLSTSAYNVAGLTVELKLAPSRQGLTGLAIPPLGEVTARTHAAPVKVSATIQRVSLRKLTEIAAGDVNRRQLTHELEIEARTAGRRFAARLLAIALLSGLVGAALLPGRTWGRVAAGGFAGLLVAGALSLSIYAGYEAKAFRQPRYTGMLVSAPWLMGTIEDRLDDLDTFRGELRALATNLNDFFVKIDQWGPRDLKNGTVRVLQVGDIHNNPAGLDLISRLVRDFEPDFVIDTGDITDYGTEVEAGLVTRLAELPVPYLFVPGNHDSPAVIETLRRLPNVRILDGAPVKVDGLTVFGLADPSSATAATPQPVDGNRARAFARQAGEIVGSMRRPDIVALHEPAHATALAGRVPVVLVGHNHQPSIIKRGRTTFLNSGTAGGAGIRAFEVKGGLPYSFKLLYFKKRPVKLAAVDSISLLGLDREFLLERFLATNSDKRNLPSERALDSLRLSLQRQE